MSVHYPPGYPGFTIISHDISLTIEIRMPCKNGVTAYIADVVKVFADRYKEEDAVDWLKEKIWDECISLDSTE